MNTFMMYSRRNSGWLVGPRLTSVGVAYRNQPALALFNVLVYPISAKRLEITRQAVFRHTLIHHQPTSHIPLLTTQLFSQVDTNVLSELG
jgi:hypothetical protein